MHWARIFADFANQSQAGIDVKGQVHGMWGGMGSLTDLTLCPENGHLVEADHVEAVNREFQDVLSPVWYAVQRTPKQ
jgi:hypothetical protein